MVTICNVYFHVKGTLQFDQGMNLFVLADSKKFPKQNGLVGFRNDSLFH
jgi:hypothetical protein